MKKSLAIVYALIAAIFGAGSGYMMPHFGAVEEEDKKHMLMADYIWINARLKQTPVIDLSVGTTEEWSQAYVDAINEQKIPLPDVQTPTNLNTVIQSHAGEKGMICDNPNTTEDIAIPGEEATP